MSEKTIGIATMFDRKDERLRNKVEIPCTYVNRKGEVVRRTVLATEAEKFMVEAIAMRLFLDRKKFIRREKLGGGIVRMSATVTLEKH